MAGELYYFGAGLMTDKAAPGGANFPPEVISLPAFLADFLVSASRLDGERRRLIYFERLRPVGRETP